MGAPTVFPPDFLQGVPRPGCRQWAGGAVIRLAVPGRGQDTEDGGGKGVPVKGAWQLCSPTAQLDKLEGARALLAGPTKC